jgi:hypothetical protein
VTTLQVLDQRFQTVEAIVEGGGRLTHAPSVERGRDRGAAPSQGSGRGYLKDFAIFWPMSSIL